MNWQNPDQDFISSSIRRAAFAFVTAGALQMVFGALFIATGEDTDGLIAVCFSAAWASAWLLIVVGLTAVWRLRIAGRWAPLIAVAGGLVYIAAELIFLVAVPVLAAEGEDIDGVTNRLLPLGALLGAVGMLATGLVALRTRHWQGWRRFAFLVVGIYPFVAMFSAIAITGSPSTVAIAGWGAAWLLLGLAARAEAGARPVATKV
jgi:hypothetical protein